MKPVIELANLPIMGGMIVFVASGTARTKPPPAQIGPFSVAFQELSRAAT
ncbi:hypothetical protein GWG65_13740 [Bradyrhizobium sp. CSA207]|nr:hypothetical protein [Bradyrhizobium sp. CSA207]MDE5442493.1 hypothetical protein [Bradyrhizobium sp. CSA207]